MKGKRIKKCALALGGLFLASAFAGCGSSGPIMVPPDLYIDEEAEKRILSLSESVEKFSRGFAESAKTFAEEGENFAVSPLSVYLSLAVAAECSAGETKEEILSAMDISYDVLSLEFIDFWERLETDGVSIANSLWINEGEQVFYECESALGEKYGCDVYTRDFAGDNENANLAVREFVKERTKGQIDVDFDLSEETIFAIVNALHFEDVWDYYGNALSHTDAGYAFANADGTSAEKKFLRDDYRMGRVLTTDEFTSFFVPTEKGYRLQFMLPADGYTAEDIFTAENLAALSEADYGGVDEENKIRYHTRCIFPEFSASFDEDIKNLLREGFGVRSLFDPDACDVTALLSDEKRADEAYCPMVRHIAELSVGKKGISAAAATLVPWYGAAGPEAGYEDVYADFVVNRSFGFVISDPNGVTLFSGIVRDIS